MTAVVFFSPPSSVRHLSAVEAVSPARLSGEGSPGDADRRGRKSPSQREAFHGRRGFDLGAGNGERQPGVVYDTETPLFDFDVLVTGPLDTKQLYVCNNRV